MRSNSNTAVTPTPVATTMPAASPTPDTTSAPSTAPTLAPSPIPTPLPSDTPIVGDSLEQPPVYSGGRWLRDQTGRIIIMQGIFEGHKPLGLEPNDEEFADPDYAKRLRDSGINVTRMAYQWAGIEPEPGAFDQARISRYKTMVERLSAQGIFTIIDSHQDMYGLRYGGNGFPDWATIDNGIPLPEDLGFPANYFQPATSHAFDNLWLNTDGILDAYS
ncbi:MAG: cellulase family glycosylhydrolase, partial [Oceanococcus sp.]